MTQYKRKPAIVEATQFDSPGEYKISQGVWIPYKASDWLVKASGCSWIVEGAVFDKLYEPVDGRCLVTAGLPEYSDARTPAERLEDETAEALF